MTIDFLTQLVVPAEETYVVKLQQKMILLAEEKEERFDMNMKLSFQMSYYRNYDMTFSFDF